MASRKRRAAAPDPVAAALQKNQRDAVALVQGAGERETQALLQRAQADLERRLAAALAGSRGEETFTVAQLRATLAQVRGVLRTLLPGMRGAILSAGTAAADRSAANAAAFLRAGERVYRGVGAQPLALREAAMLSEGVQGARASILRRIATGPDPRSPARLGVLQRYGVDVVARFERTIQAGMVARKSVREVREDLKGDSSFLRGAPGYWAHRIARTEIAGAHGRAALASIREGHRQLGDMLKVLVSPNDDRTGSDSLDVHGQVRHVEEDFESWNGPFEAPPDRSNDRATLVPWRLSWGAPPDYLQPLDDDEVQARWEDEGHKAPMPDRSEQTTVGDDEWGGAA